MKLDKNIVSDLCDMLSAFINGKDRSLRFANRLEMKLNGTFPDDERFEDLATALALYEPGGTGYFTDEGTVSKLCSRALDAIHAEQATK